MRLSRGREPYFRLFGLTVLLTALLSVPLGASELETEIRTARERVYPALINLSVVKKSYANGSVSKRRTAGSGVIISPDGYAVTNFHVVDRAEEIDGTLSSKLTLSARVVGRDPLTDLALLKFDPEQLPAGRNHFPHAQLGDSSKLEVGDYVLAMGNPMMMSQSVTLGIVSNNRRVFFSEQGENQLRFGENLQTGLFTEWIQHDASISPGSSGGPLVDLDGSVVGINARGSVTGGDMGFSIPSNQVDSVITRLKQHGSVERSWIGVTGTALNETQYDSGVIVGAVVDGSPAHDAGVEPGDRLVAINGDSVTVQFTEELASFYREIAAKSVGDSLDVTLYRNDHKLTKTVRTGRLRNRRAKKASIKRWGLNVREINEFDRQLRADSFGGVRVSSLRSGGPAEDAEPSLRKGDVIQSVDGDSDVGFDTFLREYGRRTDAGTNPETILLSLRRNGADLYSTLEPETTEEVVDRPRPLGNAWLGVRTQVVTSELRGALGLSVDYGVRVTSIYDNTSASSSNLQVGDVITRVGDRPVEARHSYQGDLFRTMIERMEVGDSVPLTVRRDGDTRAVGVRLEPAPLESDEVSSYKQNRFDFTVREVTFYDRVEHDVTETTGGVVVKSVESGGWAGVAGLEARDLVKRVSGESIEGIRHFRTIFRDIIREKPSTVSMTVHRSNETWQVRIDPNWRRMISGGTYPNDT